MERVIDNRGAPVSDSTLRTLKVFAHTLSCSGRVVARAAVGRASQEKIDRIVDRWVAHVFRISRTTLLTEREELPRPCVLVSNHHSLLDVPAICGTFPGRVRFVAKAELRKVPGFGRAMEQAGIVFVDREDRASAVQALQQAWSRIGEDSSLWIAAEGRRTDGDAIGPLKKGPFHVALAGGVPLVPVWLTNTADVLPAKKLVSRSGQTVEVRYGRPIATAGRSEADIPALIDDVRAELERLRDR